MLFKDNANTFHLLITEIEYTKELMISTALEKGFVNAQTVEISQNLDQMLNQLQVAYLDLNCRAT